VCAPMRLVQTELLLRLEPFSPNPRLSQLNPKP